MNIVRSLVLSLLVALPCIAAVTPFGAAQRPAYREITVGAPRPEPTASRVRIIVELDASPLARRPRSIRPAVQAMQPLAQFRNDLKQSEALRTAEVRHEYSRAFSGVALSVTPSQRAAIEQLPYVLRVHPDTPVTATGGSLEPGVAAVGAEEVWNRLGARGAGITVAILDTGIDYRHSALGGGFGPGFKVIGGYDFVNKDGDPIDDSGHGTHVAGIVAANSAELTGVAPDASLLAYKVLNAVGGGWTSDILAAIERTVDPNGDGDFSDHADVANMSLGGPGHAGDAMSRAVDDAVQAGVVFVVAAGNLEKFQSVSSPGTAETAITVGAIDAQNALAPFTSKGPSVVRYGIKPEVVAPGVDVRSAKLGGGTIAASGTSMATPHVAGAAALLLALHPGWTPADVKSALMATSAPHTAEVMAAGAGRIDAFRAATLGTHILPTQLAFGIIDGKAAAWSATQKIAVTNRGTESLIYQVAATGARDGLLLDASPATVSLQPGESAEVSLRVSVENAKVPYPATGSLAYSGFVELRSGNDTLRVPWAFVKAARIRVRYADEQAQARIFLGNPSSTVQVLPAIGQNEFEMATPPGAYSLLLITFAEVEPRRETTMILRDDQVIDVEGTFDLSPADAPYRLTFTANDEDGRPLRREGAEVECLPFRTLLFHTSTFGLSTLDLNYATGGWRPVLPYPPDIRTSAIPSRYTLFGGETCLGNDLMKFYAFDYAPIQGGVSADASRQTGGTELRAQKTRFLFPPGSLRLLFLEGRFIEGPFDNSTPGYLLVGWPTPAWEGTVFLAPGADPDLALRPQAIAQTDRAWFSIHPMRATGRGVASFSTGTPSPTVVVASPPDPMDFNLGPVIPKLTWAVYGNAAQVRAHFSGPHDELHVPSAPTTLRVFNRSGDLLQEETAQLTILDMSRPAVVEVEVRGMRDLQTHKSHSLLSARFGGSESDILPPSFTSLVLLDGRLQPANQLRRGLPARLRFSAVDIYSETPLPFGRVKPEATRVWARPTGTTTWHPVPVVVRDEDYGDPLTTGRDPAGSIFEAALTELAQEEGVFDLRISVEDASGNATELTLTAAFGVAEAPRRRRSL